MLGCGGDVSWFSAFRIECLIHELQKSHQFNYVLTSVNISFLLHLLQIALAFMDFLGIFSKLLTYLFISHTKSETHKTSGNVSLGGRMGQM